MATATVPDAQTTAVLRTLIAALEDKKADHLKIMNVGGLSDITDYLVLATGNSEPHLRALRIEAEKVFDAAKVPIAGTEQGGFGSGWTVMDAFQIMVHFFTAEQRENYALDILWKDAAEVDLRTMETKAAPTPKPKPVKAGKAVKTSPAPKASKSPKTRAPAKASATAPAEKNAKKAPAKPAAQTKPAAKKPTVKKSAAPAPAAPVAKTPAAKAKPAPKKPATKSVK